MSRSLTYLTGFLAAVVLVAGCAGDADTSATPSPSSPANDVGRQVDIYAAIIGNETPAGKLWIEDSICDSAGSPAGSEGCEPMSAELRSALQQRYPEAKFTHDPTAMQEDLLNEGGVIIYRLGPISGTDVRVVVPASYWCGGLCGSGGKQVVEFIDGKWKVTGTTGPVWMS